MKRILLISTLLWFAAAEICVSGMSFICNGVVSENVTDSCAENNQTIGCLFTFFRDFNDKRPLSRDFKIYDTETQDCTNITTTTFSIPCFTSNCPLKREDAFKHCFKHSIKCDNKTSKNVTTIPAGKELRCIVTLQSNHNGPLIEKMEAKLMRRKISQDITNSTCVFHKKNSSIEYTCIGDYCPQKANISTESLSPTLEQQCKAHFFRCGSSRLILHPKKYQYCVYQWNWNGDRYVLKTPFVMPSYEELEECQNYDYEKRTILCKTNCANVTLRDIETTGFCAKMIDHNNSIRKAINVVFPILLLLISGAFAYVGCNTLCKARKAHSILLQEYQLEFGAAPVTTSGDKGKKKKKGVAEGVKVKKVKSAF